MNIIYLIAGALLVLWGADRLTDGASGLARRFRLSEMVIGLTVVAFGTSLPEFVVSLTSVVKGSADLSLGNIVGSNIFNILVIVGATAVVTPIRISRSTLGKDIPFVLLASLMLVVLSMDGLVSGLHPDRLTRGDGWVLLGFFAVFMCYTFSLAHGKKGEETSSGTPCERDVPPMSYGRIAFNLLVGTGVLIGGGNLFVNGATNIALALGVSEAVVGLTIVAAGTSLPELATSVVAARKGSSAIAIGNVVGSCIFNIFFIAGSCAVLSPTIVGQISVVDMALLVFSVVLLWMLAATGRLIERWEGALLLLVFCSYTVWLIVTA